MRIYAPLPLGLPRVVPRGGDTVDGHFLPAEVETIALIARGSFQLTNVDDCVDQSRSGKLILSKLRVSVRV